GSAPDGDPMALVRRAIEVNHIALGKTDKVTGGFIGVKLYPPMGFRATDNKHLPDASFNEPAYLRSLDTGLGSLIGSKLDAALAKDHVAKCWEWTVGKILTNSAEAYADISSLGEILKTGPSRKIVDCMKAFKEHFHDSDERLLYGTDWSMIAQEERFPKLFSSRPFPDV